MGVLRTRTRLLRQRLRAARACARIWALLAAAVLALAATGLAQADGSWSQPAVIDRAGSNLVAVACPSDGRCVAIESRRRGSAWEVTFNPSTLRASAPRKVIAVTHARFSLACPAANRCVLVAEGGRAVTFDPGSGRAIASGQITHPQPCGVPTCGTTLVGDTLDSLACPSVRQCTAVAGDGVEATFNPATPERATRSTLDTSFVAVACPSPHQCTALDAAAALTFDPVSPGNVTSVVIEPGRADLFSLACPSVNQCTALTLSGDAITFDPASTGSAQRVTIDASSQPGISLLAGIACPSARRCVAADNQGRALAGDPQSTVPWTVQQVAHGLVALTAVSCAPAARCVAVDDSGEAAATTHPVHAPRAARARRPV